MSHQLSEWRTTIGHRTNERTAKKKTNFCLCARPPWPWSIKFQWERTERWYCVICWQRKIFVLVTLFFYNIKQFFFSSRKYSIAWRDDNDISSSSSSSISIESFHFQVLTNISIQIIVKHVYCLISLVYFFLAIQVNGVCVSVSISVPVTPSVQNPSSKSNVNKKERSDRTNTEWKK